MIHKTYQFDDFVLETKTRRLTQKGVLLTISSKAFEILSYLIERNGEVVKKNELIEHVWKNSFVEEANLPVHIYALRKVLNDKSREAKIIKTVSGKGYVFVSQIREISEPRDLSSIEFESLALADLNSKIQTTNSFASDLYFKGKYIIETASTRIKVKEDLFQAIDFFNSALKNDPNFAEAYLGIGQAFAQLHNLGLISTDEAHQQIKIVLRQAYLIEPHSDGLFLLEGLFNFSFELDVKNSQKAFFKALELNPNNAEVHNWLGLTSLFLGKKDLAEIHFHKASDLNPSNIAYRNGLIRFHYFSEEYNRAIIKAKEVLEMDSRSFAALHLLSASYAQLGIYEEALKYNVETLKVLKTSEVLFKRAYILVLMNKPEEGEKLIAEVLSDEKELQGNILAIASIYSARNKIDEAFEFLFKHLNKADLNILILKVDPRLKNLRKDQRFRIILKKLNLI